MLFYNFNFKTKKQLVDLQLFAISQDIVHHDKVEDVHKQLNNYQH